MNKIILGKNELLTLDWEDEINDVHYVGNNSSITFNYDTRNVKLSGTFKEIIFNNTYNYYLDVSKLKSCDMFCMYESFDKIEKRESKGKLPIKKFKSGYGYKKVKDKDGKEYVIRLTFPAKTQFVCPNHLGIKFRANQCVVDAWFNPVTKRWNKSKKPFYSIGNYKVLEYMAGNLVVVENLDTDIDQVCTAGIHFFTHFRQAELYLL